MNIIWIIISVIIGFIFLGFAYWFWQLISGLLEAGAVWLGYGVGKILGITPRSKMQTDTIVTINYLLQIGVQFGLTIWVIFTAISLIFYKVGWIEKVIYISSAVWLISLTLDICVLFIIGLMYGKVEKLLKKNQEQDNFYVSGVENNTETTQENNYYEDNENQPNICSNCKKPIQVNSKFCKYCGTKIAQS
jgi:hypothetical protein